MRSSIWNDYASVLRRGSHLSDKLLVQSNFPISNSEMSIYEIALSSIHGNCGVGTVYPSGAPEFILGFKRGSCYSIFSFMCMFCRSWFVLFLWSFCCLHLWFTDSDYPFGIIKLFLTKFTLISGILDYFELFVVGSFQFIKTTFEKKDKPWSTKHTHKTKDRVTRTPFKTEDELGCSGRVDSSYSSITMNGT
jgi:hypothetical protein